MLCGPMLRNRISLVLALVFAPLGCRDGELEGEGGSEGEDGAYPEEGVATPASEHEPLATCPSSAPVLGIAGESATDTIDLPWTSNGYESYVGDYLYFVIPDDILSLLIAVEHGAEYTAINGMAIDGEWYVDLLNAIGEAPFYHWPVEVASVAMPISMQTIPRGGCLALDPVVYADLTGETGKLHIVTRREDSTPSVIDVDIFVVGDTQITNAQITDAVSKMGEIYAGGMAAEIGEVSISTLDWPDSYVDSEGPNADDVRAAANGAAQAITILLVQDFNEVGTLGIAAGIPGPNGVPGTAASAVMISVDTHLDYDGVTLLTDLMGETMAHEAGHQIGLFHTSEDTGLDFDPISDTPECNADEFDLDGDGELLAEECDAADGHNFMFWISSEEFGQYDVSPIQAMVIRDSVIARSL